MDVPSALNYTWTYVYNGAAFTIFGMAPSTPNTFETAGAQINLTLSVCDVLGNSASNTTQILVGTDSNPPVIPVLTNVACFRGAVVSFNATGSADDVSDPADLSIEWTFTYAGVAKRLLGVIDVYTFDVVGNYLVTLKVSDRAGNSAYRTMWVNVTERVYDVRVGPFTDEDGSPVSGLIVQMQPATRAVMSNATDDAGFAHFRLQAGIFNATMEYENDTYTALIIVSDPDGRTTYPSGLPVLGGNAQTEDLMEGSLPPVLDGSGKPIKDAFVTVTIDGTDYIAKTDSEGVAHVMIPADVAGSEMSVSVAHPDYGTISYKATAPNETGEAKAKGSEPSMSKKADGSDGAFGDSFLMMVMLIVMAVIIVVLLVVVAVLRGRLRDAKSVSTPYMAPSGDNGGRIEAEDAGDGFPDEAADPTASGDDAGGMPDAGEEDGNVLDSPKVTVLPPAPSGGSGRVQAPPKRHALKPRGK